MPDATEEELEAFLIAKAEEFRTMRERLEKLADTEDRISELIKGANAALGEGDFETADDLLEEAEAVQLQSSTIVALKKQAELRIERGNAALISGDITAAADHFERSSRYFSGVNAELEAGNRHECATLLRSYGYRYKSPPALYEARKALQQNLGIWTRDAYTEKWCQTKNALGGVAWRLSQFDVPENAMAHLADAKGHYEDVRAICSEEFLPKAFATAGLDLANVYMDRRLAKSDAEYEKSLQFALRLQLSGLRHFSKEKDPRAWGILQHNLGCSYIDLSNIRTEESKSVCDIKNAIHHLELSFEVRDPDRISSIGWHRAGRWARPFSTCRRTRPRRIQVNMAAGPSRCSAAPLQGYLRANIRISGPKFKHSWRDISHNVAYEGDRLVGRKQRRLPL
jgi:tetratricopeptide (TPR) repeat protein